MYKCARDITGYRHWAAGVVRTRILAAMIDLSEYTSALLLAGVVTIVAVVADGFRRRRTANLPPGPRNWPIIGALLEMEPAFHKVLEKFAVKYGPIVSFRLGVQTVVVVSSADAAEELLKHKDMEFADRLAAMSKSAAKYTGLDGGVFPFADYDAEVKLNRKISTMEFFTIAKLKSYEKLRSQEVAVMVEDILSVIQSSNAKSNRTPPMDVRLIPVAVMMNVLFSLAIGKRFDSLPPTDELRKFPEILDNLIQLIRSLNLTDYFPRLLWWDPQGLTKHLKSLDKRQRKFYETILERSREEMRSQPEPGTLKNAKKVSTTNFVHVLLRAQETDSRITDNGIMSTIFSILAGGTDTTGSEVAWVIVELVHNPKVLKRLQDELDAVVGVDRPLEEADLQAMPFLNAVILETLRLHPSVPYSFPHVNQKPATLCGYNIPPKTAVFLNSYSIGRDPKRWKDPLKFNPDRFMLGSAADPTGSSETIKASGNCFHLLPFGSGRRVCLGYNLAMVLLTRIVGTLVHAFDWTLPDLPEGCSPENLSIGEEVTAVLYPNPRLLQPIPRLPCYSYKSNMA